nr:PREDICTED: uncharacterized protein LOC105668658 [Linepithema humile]
MNRRRKPNIPELVFKFLVADQAARDTKRTLATDCRCGQEKYRDEVVESADIPRIAGKSMGYGVRKDSDRVAKSHVTKRRPTSKDLPISFLQKCVGGEGTRKARKYIKKALDFGVESGYLIPSDPMYKVLRVSSDLMKSDSRKNRISTGDQTLSKERDTPVRLDDLQVQEQRRRRRRRRR